ncbi:MAG: putative ABC transporter permease [Roseburia sp.]|nr:putative ABC transporter permease [Roseburia sp.]MCM1099154.1 putative ABC transporter permease [Ruminococcus flavefaciens]
MNYGFYELFLIFVFWGVAGWLVEVVDMRIEAGEFQNRGFLHMPFCPMYGLGMAFATVFLNGMKDSYIRLFAFGMIFCSILEYIVGGILEKLFHSKWWDYSHMRFNVKGRVCLRNAVLFGFGAIVVFRFVEPRVEQGILWIPGNVRGLITAAFGIAFLVDLAASARRAWRYRREQKDGELRVIFKACR